MKKGSYYSIEDFYSINKIDSHLHYYSANDAFLRLAQSFNMKLVSINVDFRETEWMPLEEQKRIARLHRLNFPNHYFFIGAIPLGDPISATMIKAACHQIDTERESGAIGAKIWKNVGMKLQYNNELVMIDNPVFHPLLYHLSKTKTPLLGHFGEPLNCWLPIDEMTVESDKRYYAGHPEFHMYLQPQMPSHAQHIAASDQMLSNNQQLSFVGAHLGSSEYSIDEISKRLDAYPNMQMDLAERVCHLQHQAVKDHDKVRNFMIKYQDRLLYGSDIVFTDNKSEQEQLEEVKRRWLSQWRFFTQDDEQTTWQVNGSFKGLSLPKEVIDKLYYHNACNTYPRIRANV